MDNNKKSLGLWLGIIFIAIGLMPMVLMFFKPEGLKISSLVAGIAVSAFVFAGLSFVTQSQGRPVLARAFSLCVVLIMAFVGLYYLLENG